MTKNFGGRRIGDGEPAYIIAEIGINHNGSLDIAKKLIDVAKEAGCDAVKFQKRTPELCVPKDQWHLERDTPWGRMTYIDYRRRVEFSKSDYAEIDRHCKAKGITWFASPWDVPSVDFLEGFNVPGYKIPSALLTNHDLLKATRATGRPVILSTGMSTEAEVEAAVATLGRDHLLLAHCTSTYPCPPEELNLRLIPAYKAKYPGVPIGYSGHETGIQTTVAAVVMGATFVERHITLDRAMWGTDQSASVEPPGLERLVRDIRVVEKAMGDGQKVVYASELPARKKLRGA